MNVAIHYTLKEIASITEGEILQHPFDLVKPGYLSLDSRKIIFPESTVFVALKTPQRDGHDFIPSLYSKGVRNFLVQARSVEYRKFSSANFIAVEDTLTALQRLAAFHRHHVAEKKLTVIGITGSNGKTVVKEWLAYILEHTRRVVKSPGSYNSQVGVPLSVLHLEPSTEVAIFEAGISMPGEMERLEKIIEPSIGILTNIGEAHDAGFESLTEKLHEKLMLFSHCEILIYNTDDPRVGEAVSNFQNSTQAKGKLDLFSWGAADGNMLRVLNVKHHKRSSTIVFRYENVEKNVTIPFTDGASVQNAIHCLSAALVLNLDFKVVESALASLYPIAMRLQLKEGINNCTLINDSYSNDLSSLGIALNFLNQQKQHANNTLILTDIEQAGESPGALYAHVATLLQQKKVQRLIGIGPEISCQKNEFSFISSTAFFPSLNEFISQMPGFHFRDENILIKGARSFGLEKIVNVLEKRVHQTALMINLNSIVHNLNAYRKKIPSQMKIMAMVKAFSYGSGSYEIASVLEYHNIDYLAVAYTDEGIDLRKGGVNVPVMIMNIDETAFQALIQYNLEPELFSFAILDAFTEYLKHNGYTDIPVHLKIDTGMHRLGFTKDDLPQLLDRLVGNNLIRIKSVFTHLVASENPSDDAFTAQQLAEFKSIAAEIDSVLNYPVIKHAQNTAGISRHDSAGLDMVRLGIGLYGIASDPKMSKVLQPASKLVTTISQIKQVKAGESVGYGRTAILSRDSYIATVRIGYADGYPRALGNGKGKMFIKEQMVPTVGNICMDMTMLDITDFKEAKEGEEVEVFGEHISLHDLAAWAATIPYEIMTGISQRVNRIYYEE